jgi:hypothetical protein
MRRNRAAGVLVGVNQRGQRPGGTENRVQIQAQLAGDGVVGPEPGRRDDPVDGDRLRVAAQAAAGDLYSAVVGHGTHYADGETGEQPDPAGLDVVAQHRVQRAAGGKRVVVASAVGTGRARCPDRPRNCGSGLLLGEGGQC